MEEVQLIQGSSTRPESDAASTVRRLGSAWEEIVKITAETHGVYEEKNKHKAQKSSQSKKKREQFLHDITVAAIMEEIHRAFFETIRTPYLLIPANQFQLLDEAWQKRTS